MSVAGVHDGSHRRILVASPIEPSGASWLLNCFLELGIRIDHRPVERRVWRGSALQPGASMWTGSRDGCVTLNPKAGVLMKFLPALARREVFRFREDVSVEYVQDFPSRKPEDRARVLMVRDPRDAHYSSYRRSAPAFDFAEFLRFPNPETLLDRSTHWALFISAWLSLPGVQIVRFEDYKRDAEATLRPVLAGLGLAFSDSEIAGAVRLSSFESARDAERATRDRFPHDRQVANRSGSVGEARNHADIKTSISAIEHQAAAALRVLCYEMEVEAEQADDPFLAARLGRAFLAFFETVHLPAQVTSVPVDMAASEGVLAGLLAFAHKLDAGLLARANMPPAEARTLIDSLAEFVSHHAEWLVTRLASTRPAFCDGSGYFFQRIREMRQAGTPSAN